jgi:hypothetical protein
MHLGILKIAGELAINSSVPQLNEPSALSNLWSWTNQAHQNKRLTEPQYAA